MSDEKLKVCPFKVGDLVTTDFHLDQKTVVRRVVDVGIDESCQTGWRVVADCGEPCSTCKTVRGSYVSLDADWYKAAGTDCNIDLTRTDEYEGRVVPDADVGICLKVLRTVRNTALGPKWFDANAAVVLSLAHAVLHDAVKKVMEIEKGEAVKC